MSATELKEKIYKVVGDIEDTAFLQMILNTAQLPFRVDNESFTEEELKMLNERSEKYHRGEAELIPWRESLTRTRQKYGL